MDRLQYHQQILPLLLRHPCLENCDLIGMGFGHTQRRRQAIEEIGSDRIGRPPDAIELAPSERLDGPWLPLAGMGCEQLHIGHAQPLGVDRGKNTFQCGTGRDRPRRRGRWREPSLCRAGGIGLGHTVIGAVEVVEQRARRRAGR